MNTVTCKSPINDKVINYGSIFEPADGSGGYHMLCVVGANRVVAVSLSDGCYWNPIEDTITAATKGLRLVAHSAKITIEPEGAS